EVGMNGSPEWRQYPTRALRIFPTRHASPNTCGSEINFFVAKQRRAIQRRLMVFTSGRIRVEQVDSTFLTAGNHQLSSFVFENCRRYLHIQVTFDEPRPIGWDVP